MSMLATMPTLGDAPRVFTTWPDADVLRGGAVVTVGVFDGLHRGHQELVRRTREHASEMGLAAVLVTFDPHPLTVTNPSRAPRQLLSLADRVDVALNLGIDAVVVLSFNRQLADTPALDFVRHGLVERLHTRHVVVGENFRFGVRGEADTTRFAELGQQFGFDVEAVPLVTHGGQVCSSTNVRELLSTGDAGAAGEMIGRASSRLARPTSSGE